MIGNGYTYGILRVRLMGAAGISRIEADSLVASELCLHFSLAPRYLHPWHWCQVADRLAKSLGG